MKDAPYTGIAAEVPVPAAKAPAAAASTHGKNLYIQGARGLFCLMVFVYHVHNSHLGTFPILQTQPAVLVLSSLQVGVELFFGLSGIVIIGSLQRTQSLPVFMWDRITRILPVLWATNFAVLAVSLAAHIPLPDPVTLGLSFLSLPSPFHGPLNPIAWTLNYEMCFYIFCGLAWRFGNHPVLKYLFFLPVAIWVLLSYPRTLMMLAGAIVALRFFKPEWIEKHVRPSVLLFLAPLLFLVYVLGMRLLPFVMTHGNIDAVKPLEMPFPSNLVAAAALAVLTTVGMLTLAAISTGAGALRWLDSRIMVFLGEISYSFYLWHIPIMGGVKRLLIHAGLDHNPYSQLLFLVICLPITVAVAYVSHRVIEVYITKRLRRLAHPQRA